MEFLVSQSVWSVAMKATKYSLALVAVLFAFTETIFADEIATAYADLNWAAVHFSGPVLPISTLFVPTSTEARGRNLTTNEETDTSSELLGWGTSTSKVQFGPRDYAQASADGLLTAFSSTTGNYALQGGVTRAGLIQSVDGTISIDIPYTYSVTTTSSYIACAFIFLFVFNPTRADSSSAGNCYQDNGIDISNSGFLSVSFRNLPIGSYSEFEFEAGAEASHIGEPSTSLLLAFSLACLGCLSFWKRFSQYRHTLIMN
jgi:hypothetical protein